MRESSALLARFGMREQPFAPTADPSYFFASRDHKSCLFRLWNSIDERHGIALVLGNYGTGKTTLLRKLMTAMSAEPDKYTTAVIGSPIPSWTSFALLEAIILQFGLRPERRSFAAYMEQLNRFLLAHRNKVNTLIIDDAQNLNKRGQLELLRLAQNLETPQHKLLNLVLFSQLEWVRVLEAAPNFRQRINMTYTLEPLKLDEVRQFIDFRLAQAGAAHGNGPIFEDQAVEIIYRYSQGNPRVLVTLCRNTLLLAAQLRTSRINGTIVWHTIKKTTVPDAAQLNRARDARPELPAAPPANGHQTFLGEVAEPEGIDFSLEEPYSPAGTRTNAYEARANALLNRVAREKLYR